VYDCDRERVFYIPPRLDRRGVALNLMEMDIGSTFVASVSGSITCPSSMKQVMIHTHPCVIESIEEAQPVPTRKATKVYMTKVEPSYIDFPYTGYNISVKFGKIFILKNQVIEPLAK